MNALIIYHRADYDGVFSMLVAYDFLSSDSDIENIDLLGWNYGDQVPEITNDIAQNYDRVVMVDISFPPEAMLELKEMLKYGVETLWIDHHATAIDNSEKFGYNDLPGLRYDGLAAVENTWNFFFSSSSMPPIIQLLGTYDVWNKNRFDWDGMVLPLQFALKAKYKLSTDKLFPEWPWLKKATFDDLMPLIESGKLILEYLRGTWGSAIKNYSWEVRVAGKYRGIVCMSTEFSSNLFGPKVKEYDVCIVLNWRPANNCFGISMYMEPENKCDFHAGEYLRANYNGGGHKCAAGGRIEVDQFLKLLKDCEI